MFARALVTYNRKKVTGVVAYHCPPMAGDYGGGLA